MPYDVPSLLYLAINIKQISHLCFYLRVLLFSSFLSLRFISLTSSSNNSGKLSWNHSSITVSNGFSSCYCFLHCYSTCIVYLSLSAAKDSHVINAGK